jgi:hypothetical protein
MFPVKVSETIQTSAIMASTVVRQYELLGDKLDKPQQTHRSRQKNTFTNLLIF